MERRDVVIGLAIAILCALCCCVAANPSPRKATDESASPSHGTQVLQSRSRRKVGELNITAAATALEFVRKLYTRVADENGRPRNGSVEPASVWCLLDKDVAADTYRKSTTHERCSATFNFVFNWDSLADKYDDRDLSDVKLRVYQEVIQRHINIGDTNVTIHTGIRYINSNSSFVNQSRDNLNMLSSESAKGRTYTSLVKNTSNEWLMLDISEGVRALWPPRSNSTVEISARVTVNCKDRKKVPVNFINPAEISLDQPTRRERHLSLQPLLVINLIDESARLKLEQQLKEEVSGPELKLYAVDGDEDSDSDQDVPGRRRRRSVPSYCHIENFSITFADLNLNNILTPSRYNIRKCAGTCGLIDLRSYNRVTVTNHAKILASADYFGIENSSPPCCVPLKYSPAYLMLQHRHAVEVRLFPEFSAEKCGCK